MRRLKHPVSDRGLTLLELTVAIFVLALGSLAALRAADQSRHAIGAELPRLLARVAAENRLEELHLLGPAALALPPQVLQGGQIFHLAVTREATEAGLFKTTVTARAESGEGAVLTGYLFPQVPR